MKKWNILLLILVILGMPIPCYAYSNRVILGGENIGIHIDTPGILVIGFYKVNGKYLKSVPEIQIGDYITHVNDEEIKSIEELTQAIENNMENNLILTLKRNDKTYKTALPIEQVDGVYKTGLYVKDGITGIGTLSYIDPETKIYGALGHEIVEGTTGVMVEVKKGSIYETNVTSIRKSSNGSAGEKNAKFYYDQVNGNILDNTNHGIFGEYIGNMNANTIEVANPDEIELGSASIYTVLNGNTKKEYHIEITKIQEQNDIKNLSFVITDEELIQKAGGIVQGMSGSPIVQNNKIIGAVTHVVVDNPITGYGIFITTMLENGDKIKSE